MLVVLRQFPPHSRQTSTTLVQLSTLYGHTLRYFGKQATLPIYSKPYPHHTSDPHLGPTRICPAIDRTLDSIHPLDALHLSYSTPFVCSGSAHVIQIRRKLVTRHPFQAFDGPTRLGNGDRVCVPLVLLALHCSA